jgi:CheY-like chemotaxis protein
MRSRRPIPGAVPRDERFSSGGSVPDRRLVVTERTFTLRSREEDDRLRELARRAPDQVVLVEDDGERRRRLAYSLRMDGHHVIEARGGAEALEVLGSLIFAAGGPRRPTVVVTSLRLPHFSGLEILEAVRLTGRHIPVILLGDPEDEDERQAQELGAARLMREPADTDAVRDAVRTVLPG